MANKKKEPEFRTLLSQEEVLKLKTSKEVLLAMKDNPCRLEIPVLLYKRELSQKEYEERTGYKNPLMYLLDQKAKKNYEKK